MTAPLDVREALSTAAQVLAGRCNHARSLDGAGFSRFDTEFGHRLAQTPAATWSAKMTRAAWKTLRKYRAQLAGAGIDFEAIPEPPEPVEAAPKTVTLQGQTLQARFPYETSAIALCKQLGGRWDPIGKTWQIPASLPAVEALAGAGFAVSPEARAASEERTAAAAAIAAVTGQPFNPTVVTVQRTVAINGVKGGFDLNFPYDQEIINVCRATPGAAYDRVTRLWHFPPSAAPVRAIRRIVSKWAFTIVAPADAVLAEIEAEADRLDSSVRDAVAASQATDAALEIPWFGVTPFPFQRAGIKYAVERKRVIIGDDMGLGKTIQGLGTLELLDAYPAVIVVPASLKLNWLREARRAVPHRTAQILDGNSYVSLMVVPDLTIVNYDILHRHVARLKQLPIKAVVCDEAHLIKSAKARRTKAVLGLTEAVQADVRLALTGTPVLNRAGELESILAFLGRLDSDFGGQKQFRALHATDTPQQYGMAKGSENLIELNTRLRATCFVRRLKADVLTELPAKQKAVQAVELSNKAEYDKAQHDVIEWLRRRAAEDASFLASIDALSAEERLAAIAERAASAAERARRAETLVRINTLRQLAAVGKLAAVTEWVENFLESGEKLVLFAWHTAVVKALAAAFRCDTIAGDDSKEARQAAVDRFQTDPDAKVLVLNMKSGGVGITLTAASNVAIVELPWTPGDLQQAEDRVHRIGQTNQVTAWYFLADDTIDGDMNELLEKKHVIVTAAQDGVNLLRDDDETDDMLGAVVKRLLGEPAHAVHPEEQCA